MAGDDELQAALERRHGQDDAETHRLRVLEQRRRDYERKEEAVRQQLYEAVERTVEALAKATTPTKELAVTPLPQGFWGLFERQKHAVGWEVHLERFHEHVLCPDGTLIRRQLSFDGPQPLHSTFQSYLRMQVDGALSRVRRDAGFNVNEMDFFAEAFGNQPYQGQEQKIQELSRRLASAKAGVMNTFADILHQIGVSAL